MSRDREIISKSWLRVAIELVLRFQLLLPLSIYIVFNSLGLHGFQLSHSDYTPMMQMLLQDGGGQDGFFAIPIYFYTMLSSIGVDVNFFGLIAGGIFIIFLFREDVPLDVYLVKFFLFLSPLVTFLGQPGKELFLMAFLISAIWLIEKGRFNQAVFCLFVYAIFFRYYYLVLPFVLYAWCNKEKTIKFFIFIVPLLGVLCFEYGDRFIDAIVSIQARRDYGFYASSGVVRTSFSNPMEPNGLSSIVVNYLHAFFVLNFPIHQWFTYKEAFLQLNVLVICLLLFSSFRKGARLALPTLVMVLVFPVFEPDLGSYLRHLCSLIPIYFYLLDKKFIRIRF